jgi:hypothetical protein
MLDFQRKTLLLLSPGGAMGQNVTGKQATGLNYSREINYACAKLHQACFEYLGLTRQ